MFFADFACHKVRIPLAEEAATCGTIFLPQTAAEEEIMRVEKAELRIRLTPELHACTSAAAAKRDTTATRLTAQVLFEWLKAHDELPVDPKLRSIPRGLVWEIGADGEPFTEIGDDDYTVAELSLSLARGNNPLARLRKEQGV